MGVPIDTQAPAHPQYLVDPATGLQVSGGGTGTNSSQVQGTAADVAAAVVVLPSQH